MHKLTKYQHEVLIPKIIRDFKTKWSRNHKVTSAYYCKMLNEEGYKIQETTFRFLVKYIQANGLLKYIVADNQGFYRTSSKSVVERQIQSLMSREFEIRSVRMAMESQIGIRAIKVSNNGIYISFDKKRKRVELRFNQSPTDMRKIAS